VILAGYASGSKWSLFGAMREAAQVVSYEVPIGLCVVVPVLIVGSMNLVTIGEAQAGLFTNWLIFHDPFTFFIFFVYFTCAVASVNRAPFDLAEAESELVAGFHTEYSGLRWSFFFMAEYGSMFLVSGLAAILFYGGWHGPVPIFSELLPVIPGFDGSPSHHWAYDQSETNWRVLGYISQLAGVTNFILKACVFVTVMMWVRWTLPRLRIDQVMTTCLKYCVPLAAACFVGAMLWKLSGVQFINDMARHRNQTLADVRESWVLYKEPAAAKPAEPEKPAEPAKPTEETKPAAATTDQPTDRPPTDRVARQEATP
jgi:NADH-quinone oxidoreductase subunit H